MPRRFAHRVQKAHSHNPTIHNSLNATQFQLSVMSTTPGHAQRPQGLPQLLNWIGSHDAAQHSIYSFPKHKASNRNEKRKFASERAAMVPLLTNNRMKSTTVYRFVFLSLQSHSQIELET